MKKKLLFYLSTLLLIILFSWIYISFIKQTKGFCIKKILSSHKYSPRWDFGPPSPEQDILLERVSSETFSFLGSGRECYAFVSEDGELVIKFFKQNHMKPPSILIHLPLPRDVKLLCLEKLNRRTFYRHRLFSSYQLAYNYLRKETGLLFLHLNKSRQLKRKLHLKDLSGEIQILDMDETEFIIQKRAFSIFEYLQDLMKQNDIEASKAVITSILDLIEARGQLGIEDDDTNCERNLGLIEGQAIQIDLGNFHLALPYKPSRQIFEAATHDLQCVLDPPFPSLSLFLQNEIDRRTL